MNILPFDPWLSGTTQPSVPFNANLLRMELLSKIIGQGVTAQPGSPADGDAYVLGAVHTGVQWDDRDEGDLVIFRSGTWYWFAPVEGVVIRSNDGDLVYASGDWVSYLGS